MTAVADTSILVDYLRDVDAAVGLVEGALERGAHIRASTVTRLELRAGERHAERAMLDPLFAALDWVSVDVEIADRAGALARSFSDSHPGIEIADYAVAATTERLGGELWTLNVRHFPMFPDLTPPY